MSKPNLVACICLLMVCCAFWSPVSAQSGNATYFQPSVFPSSPNTASFARFGSYPVNMYTGVPDISIPLYTIESGGLNVPVTLSYHAAGIKISDAASWVGLGWSLNCGGSITRRVYGLPDEVGYLLETKRSSWNLQNNNDLDYVMQTVEWQQHDNMPDIYLCQVPGYTGRFFYDADSSFKIMNVPRSPVSVVGTHGYEPGCSCYAQKFDIADEHGNTYRLGYKYREITATPGSKPPSAISAWMLENMISQDRRDTISFNYVSGTYQLPDGMSETISVEDNALAASVRDPGYSANINPVTTIVNNPSVITDQQLSTVFFKNGRIDFVRHATNRQDLSTPELDTMKVSIYNFSAKKYEVQKSIVFVKSYFGSGGKGAVRLRLDGIQVLDKAGSITGQYYFTYNNSVSLPPYWSLARDFWGYYNGNDNSTDLIPKTTVQMISNGAGTYNINIGNPNDPNSSCRNIDTTKMQANILTSITYPTGGHTNFTYETNRYKDATNNLHLAGGLRIHSIASYDTPNTATPIVKTYQYDVANANFFADPAVNMTYGILSNTQTYRDWVYTGDPTDPNIIGGYVFAASKRVRRWYSQPNEDLELNGVPVGYAQVTEYQGTPLANTGKTVYKYSWYNSGLEGGGGITGVSIYFDYSFANGLLLSKKDYLRKSDGSYQIVKADTNTYGAFPGTVGSFFYYDDVGTAMGQRQYNDGALAPGNPAYYGQETPDDESTYFQGDFAIESGDTYLTSATSTTYDQSDTTKFVTSSTIYKYDNLKHQQVSRTYHTDSRGNTRVSVNKYPADYSPGNAVIDSMVVHNMQADVIEKWDTLKNVKTGLNAVVSGQLYVYKAGSQPGSIVPAKISTLSVTSPVTNFTPSYVTGGVLTGDSRYVQMISFDQYDLENNIIQYTPRNATPTSIFWDYQYENPVAQVKNATIAAGSAYTSFEADARGNWNYGGTPVVDLTAPMGSYVYPLSTGSVSTIVSGPGAYILSLWSNGSAPTVYAGSYLTGTALTSTGGWIYYEYQVPAGASSVTVSGSASIDELRLYPAMAQMITYAYAPEGVTAIADAKGSISHFEYDYFHRLKNVKDFYGNIVNNYSYHTYDQTVGNQAQSGSFTRNNCPYGTSPGSLSYNVPANKYYSSTLASANAEAVYDLNINGQAKANQNCGCPILYINVTVTNSSGIAGFPITFSGLSTYYVPTGTSNISVPENSYATVQIGPLGSGTHNYSLGAFPSQNGVHYAVFNNVQVVTGPTLNISIN
jgi:hypothetical protein